MADVLAPDYVYDFTLKQGSKHDEEFQYLDGDGNPVDITGYLIRTKARQPRFTGAVVFEGSQADILPITDGPQGKFAIRIPSNHSITPWDGAAFYDIELVPPTGEVDAFRLVEGEVRFRRSQTY